MKLEANFSEISTAFEDLAEGVYRVVLEEIKEGETKENKLPQLSFLLAVTEGDRKGAKVTDFVTLKQKDGKVNNVGLGRVKAYAEAILGKEAANGGAIDTDELKGGSCEIVIKHEPYEKDGQQKMGIRIKKVLPLG